MAAFETIQLERRDAVAIVTLHRPEALNALSATVMTEVGDVLAMLDREDDVGCVILTGSEKAFAAGADIKEMASRDYPGTYIEDWFAGWDAVTSFRKPLIAAVAGFALGGGCELAMMCDFIIAADNARFGQPEIKLGVMPGMGGSQRLTRAIGKAKAMEMILTGRMMDAEEAERSGLVARVVDTASLLDEALAVAGTIAAMSTPIAMMAKESVNRAYETTLAEGVLFERRVFHAMFATVDQKEGMAAFAEKRPAVFRGR
jgi:enoyl-CoA hydratase